MDSIFQSISDLNEALHSLKGLETVSEKQDSEICLYDLLILDQHLRKKTRKLFMDGHHARAVEEAFKYVDNLVKQSSGVVLSGSKLMQDVFSPNNPKLRINAMSSDSEKDEQSGYMQILSGCMTGIRNPRAHESDWEDNEFRALQLLVLANHLIERIRNSEKSESTPTHA